MFILEDWTRYHAWEDGRSNYAWDLSAINSELMTYSGQGQNLSEFAVFGLDLYLPLSGVVANVETNHPDNPPELNKALEFNTLDNGSEADLKEKPHNLVEITPGGPFLLRILHMQQVFTIFLNEYIYLNFENNICKIVLEYNSGIHQNWAIIRKWDIYWKSRK